MVESIDNPVGKVGDTVQDTTSPPLTDGVAGVMVAPFVKDKELGL